MATSTFRPAKQVAITTPAAFGAPRDVLFRWLVTLCFAATILITWPLWTVHTSPPMLPALSLPAVDMGAILLAALLVVLVRPLPGIAILTVLVLYAMTIDQTRMQPEIFSMIFLLWGTLPLPGLKTLARCHLIAMWLFAGWYKLLSERFHDEMALRMLSALPVPSGPWMHDYGGYLIACSEMGVALLVCIPRLRRIGAVAVLALHATILYVLLPTGNDVNRAVWPWNVALAFAGFALFAPQPRTMWRQFRHAVAPVRIAMLVILLSPLGWYVGITDAYLSHHLYTDDVPIGRTPALAFMATRSELGVPLPPEHRLFRQYFQATCGADDVLTIEDTRWWYTRDQRRVTFVECDADGT